MGTTNDPQTEMREWLARELPGSGPDPRARTLLLAEEVGEIARAVSKRHEGIRGTYAEWTANLRDEIADAAICLYALADCEGFDLNEVVRERVAIVTARRYATAPNAAALQEGPA